MGLIRYALKPFGCLLYAIGAALVALAILAGVGIWAANHYGPGILRNWIEATTGYSVTYDSADAQILLGDFEASGLRVFNPAAFGEPSFIEGGHILIDADPLSALFSKTVLIHEGKIEIDRLTVVFDGKGKNNFVGFLNAWRPARDDTAEAPPKPPKKRPPRPVAEKTPSPDTTAPAAAPPATTVPAVEKTPPPPPWRVAKLRLVVRQVRLTLGGRTLVDWPLNYDHTFSHVSDLGELARELRADLLGRIIARQQEALNSPAP